MTLDPLVPLQTVFQLPCDFKLPRGRSKDRNIREAYIVIVDYRPSILVCVLTQQNSLSNSQLNVLLFLNNNFFFFLAPSEYINEQKTCLRQNYIHGYKIYSFPGASAHLERRIPKAREHELHVLGCQQPGAMAEAQGLQQRSHVEIRIKNITILNGTGAQNPSQSEDRSMTTHYSNSHSLHQWNQQKDG